MAGPVGPNSTLNWESILILKKVEQRYWYEIKLKTPDSWINLCSSVPVERENRIAEFSS